MYITTGTCINNFITCVYVPPSDIIQKRVHLLYRTTYQLNLKVYVQLMHNDVKHTLLNTCIHTVNPLPSATCTIHFTV